MPWPHTFGAESGTVGASQLDDNFNAAAFASDLAATDATVAALPSSTTPLAPVAAGSAGVGTTLSRTDHKHPTQAANINFQTGTSYTLQASDNGGTTDLSNAAAITVTLPNSLAAESNGMFVQSGAGQVSFTAASGATIRQASGYTKTRAQWSVVTWFVRTNSGGSAAEYVLSGDMSA